MAKRLILKRLLNEYYNDDMAPSNKLFEHQEQHVDIRVYVLVNCSGMEVNYTYEMGGIGFDFGEFPLHTLCQKTQFINAEAVRKLFGAENYSEMIKRIKDRFHTETAYDDLLNYLHEHKIV